MKFCVFNDVGSEVFLQVVVANVVTPVVLFANPVEYVTGEANLKSMLKDRFDLLWI